MLDPVQFIRRHKSIWAELDDLLELFQGRSGRPGARKRPDAGQIDRLTELYRQASAHLACLRNLEPEGETVRYLNRLVARAHNVLYQDQYTSGHQLRHFFLVHFVSLIRQRHAFILVACLLFAVGAVSGFVSVMTDPLNLYAALPDGIAENVDPNRLGEGHDDWNHAIVSTEIMTNNIRVAILAYVSGVTFGLGTVYLLVYNGLIIGALAAVYWHAGKSYPFWAYILPHGVIELTAIFIAGGAGLYMGYRMFVPGPYPRKQQFLRSARESVQLLLGTFPLFVVAGVIEGYVTPSDLSLEAKYAFAGITLLLAFYYAYGLFRRRADDRVHGPEAGSHSPEPGTRRPEFETSERDFGTRQPESRNHET